VNYIRLFIHTCKVNAGRWVDGSGGGDARSRSIKILVSLPYALKSTEFSSSKSLASLAESPGGGL